MHRIHKFDSIQGLLSHFDFAFDPIFDQQIHRFRPPGSRSGKSGWYCSRIFKGKRSLLVGDWKDNSTLYSWSEYETTDVEIKIIVKKETEDREKINEEKAIKNKEMFEKNKIDHISDFGYLWKKKIKISDLPSDISFLKIKGVNVLAIPLSDKNGKFWNFQMIADNGKKLFCSGKVGDCFYKINGNEDVILCEGFATGMSIHKAIGSTVIVCFSAGNLIKIAKQFKGKNAIVACDNDSKNEVNTGLEAGKKIKNLYGIDYIIPENKDTSITDFNDIETSIDLPYLKDVLNISIEKIRSEQLFSFFGTNDLSIYYEKVDKETGAITYHPDYLKAARIFKDSKRVTFSSHRNLMFNDGYWSDFDKLYLENMILKLGSIHVKPHHIGNFVRVISANCVHTDSNFKDTDDLINISNGILNIKTRELSSHSSSYQFMQKIDVEYSKESKCEKWIDFLNDIFDNDAERVLALQKIFGYILLGGRPFLQKAFVFTGSGRNGKGIVIAVLRSLLGTKSFSTVSMDNFNKSFSLVHLDGKLANIVEETPSTVNAEVFKNIVGGGFVTDSLKGKDQYSFRVQARLVFACNDIPKFEDKNVSILDRLFIIPFDKHYAEGVNLDPLLEEKIHDEISGILNWALDGANMVMASKIIEQPKISVELKDNYRRENDSAYDWFVDCCDISIDNNAVFNSVDHIYLNYRQWAEANGNGILSKMSFSKRLQAILKQSGRDLFKDGTVFRTIESKKYRGYYGIKMTRVFIERDIFNKPMAILRIEGS